MNVQLDNETDGLVLLMALRVTHYLAPFLAGKTALDVPDEIVSELENSLFRLDDRVRAELFEWLNTKKPEGDLPDDLKQKMRWIAAVETRAAEFGDLMEKMMIEVLAQNN